MSDNNGWPGKPGVPLNPEKTGWHWLSGALERPAAFEWLAHKQAWLFHRAQPEDQAMAPPAFGSWTYLGPCLTPAEVDARVKEAEAKIAAGCLISNASEVADLAAQARRDALEEAARAAENEPEPEGDLPPELHGRSVKNIAIASVRATKRSIAAAIRALKGEGDE